jgi:hypothetical protein
MRGDSLITASADPPLLTSQLGLLSSSTGIGGEAKRMGTAYLVGRQAGGGSTVALHALMEALRSPQPATQRCGIWGLVAAGDAATLGLLRMLGGGEEKGDGDGDNLALLIRAATALGESCQHPTVEVVHAIGAAIGRMRRAAAVVSAHNRFSGARVGRRVGARPMLD